MSYDEKDLLATIWTKPRLTFEYIFKCCPKKYVFPLQIFGAVTGTLGENYANLTSEGILTIPLLIIIFGLCGLITWLFTFILSVLWSWTGSCIKGKASYEQFTFSKCF
jgi:hypothetical protein